MDSKNDIEKIAYNFLKESKSLGVYPTPIKNLLNYSELVISKNIDLSKIHESYFTKKFNVLKSAMTKLIGLVDFREKTISVDLSIKNNARKKFIKLHEVGHFVLPWQKKMYGYLDDEKNLSVNADDLCEQEANHFASSTLFQLDLFEHEAQKLSLNLDSAISLSKKFGSSIHSSLRRYVEYSNRKCGLIVLEKFDTTTMSSKLKDLFYSKGLYSEIGHYTLPNNLDLNYPFMSSLLENKMIGNGTFALKFGTSTMSFDYQYFNNTYNHFIFMYPRGETNKTRTNIILLNNGKVIQ